MKRFVLVLLWVAVAIPTVEAAGRPSVARYFGPAPQNCPIANSSLIHPYKGYIWVGSPSLRGYSLWYMANRRLALGFGDRTKYGYPQKIFWQLASSVRGPVSLRGWNVRTGQPIWFGRPLPDAHPKPLVPGPVIAWPSAIIRYRRAPSLTFVPGAGCYVLEARWKGGSWTMPFTAGG